MQKVVAVDIGNSAIKLAVGEGGPVVRLDSKRMNSDVPGDHASRELEGALKDLEDAANWLVCSVDCETTARLKKWVAEHRPQDDFSVISASDIDLKSKVKDREKLGRDRLLASWYASVVTERNFNAIVVDAGTAVTIDLVLAETGHAGGLIFPGSTSCLAALAATTDALPDLTDLSVPELSQKIELGKSTQRAILLGVHQLQLFGIIAMVRSLEQQFQNCVVHCCGGGLESSQAILPPHWSYKRDWLIDAIFCFNRRLS